MLFYLIVFVFALITTLILTPQIIKLARRLKAFDQPDERKIHQEPIPRLGGISLYIGFVLSLIFGYFMLKYLKMTVSFQELLPIIGILIGSTVVVITGIIDDIYDVSVSFKFIGQIIAAMIAIGFGVQIYFWATPFNTLLYMGIWAVPFTLLWIVGITNAVNLIDGLDGLAAGITTIAAFTLFIVALKTGQLHAAVLSIILAGVSIGFLRYNFNPASIFLGDSGSLFLGFLLATFSVVGVLKSTLVIAFVVPIFILGIPIYDTATVIMHRVKAKQKIFQPDKRHFHHRLLNAGFTHKEVVVIIYLACALLSFAALIATAFNDYQVIIFLSLIVVTAIVGIDFAKGLLRRAMQNSEEE